MLGDPLMADGAQICGAIAAEPGREQGHDGADRTERDEHPGGVHEDSPPRVSAPPTSSTPRISRSALRSIFRMPPLGIRPMS